MKKLPLVIALIAFVPGLRAQQTEPKDKPVRTDTQIWAQPGTDNQAQQNSLPAAIRPGHPLDPADVEILTGKRDRDNEAARRAALPIMVGGYSGYGTYGDYYWMSGRLGRAWDIPMLPFPRIASPFLFGLGGGGFRARR